MLEVVPTCRRCDVPIPAVMLEELAALGWGDGGTTCPTCRARRNVKARAAATRIVAAASMELVTERPGGRLATIRRLPDMRLERSIPFWGDGLSEQLPETWGELGDGFYLLTIGDGRSVRHIAVQIASGVIEQMPVTEEEVARLPALIPQSSKMGRRHRQQLSSSPSAPTSESVSGSGQAQ